MLTNSIIIATSGCDTLRPLGIQFSPFANTRRDNNIMNGIDYFQGIQKLFLCQIN